MSKQKTQSKIDEIELKENIKFYNQLKKQEPESVNKLTKAIYISDGVLIYPDGTFEHTRNI